MGLILSFFLLGLSTFLIETFWLKQNIAVFGSTYQSAGLLLCAYFLGTALGNFHWGAKSVRFSQRLVITAAAMAVALSFFIYFVLYKAGAPDSQILKFGLTLVAAFPLSFLFGAFFPIVARQAGGGKTAALYGFNALGSFAGILSGSFILPPILGYRAIYLTGAALLIAALVIFCRAIVSQTGTKQERPAQNAFPGIYRAGFLSGFLTLLLEVVFLRQISMGTDNTVYAFGSVTVTMLALMFAVSMLVSKLPEKYAVNAGILPAVMVLSSLGILLSAHLFTGVTDGLKTVIMDKTSGPWESFAFSALFVPAGLIFPVAVFPLLIRKLGPAATGNPGLFFGVNSLGCALGALAGGFLFPNLLGLWGMVLLCALMYALFPMVVSGRRTFLPIAACVVLVFVLNPLRHPRVTPDPLAAGMPAPANLLSVSEGNYGTVSVIDFGPRRTLWLNSTYVLGGNQSPSDDRRLGLFPLMFRPAAESAAVIGIATGITASGLLNSGLKSITCIELVPEVRDAAVKYFSADNRSVLSDPRVKTVIDDGRNFIRSTDLRFDIVLSDLFVPWHEGTGALYTLEHFTAVREKLKTGGLFLLWLPAYEITEEEFCVIARTFCEVFPCVTLWQNTFSARGPVIGLFGMESPMEYGDIDAVFKNRPGPEEKDFIEKDPAGLLVRFVCPFTAADGILKEASINTMDRPVIEFMAATKERQLLTGGTYMEFVKRMMEKERVRDMGCLKGFPVATEQYRSAGFYMMNSLNCLVNGEKMQAYQYFDMYKSLTPEAIHQ